MLRSFSRVLGLGFAAGLLPHAAGYTSVPIRWVKGYLRLFTREMSMRGRQRAEDQIDIWCNAWARQRRIALGISEYLGYKDVIEPKERLGQLRCTLAKVKTEREGASYTKASQQFPEVYTGVILLIHRGYSKLPGEQRMVMHLRYVWREIPVVDKAPTVPLSIADYWRAVDNVKSFLTGFIASTPLHPIGELQIAL
jgi:hypothetical protein